MHNTDQLVDTATAAERLHVDRSTFTRWVKAGKITPVAKGAGIRGPMFFSAPDVEALAAGESPALASGADRKAAS